MTNTISPAIMRAVNGYDSEEARIDALARLTGYSKSHAREMLAGVVALPVLSPRHTPAELGIVPPSRPKPERGQVRQANELARQERIKQALELARDGSLSLNEIARRIGVVAGTAKVYLRSGGHDTRNT